MNQRKQFCASCTGAAGSSTDAEGTQLQTSARCKGKRKELGRDAISQCMYTTVALIALWLYYKVRLI